MHNNRRHLLPRKRRPGRTRKTWGGDGRGSGGGKVASQMERGLLRQWAGLALPVAVTPGFPLTRRPTGETHSTVNHRPAGHQVLAWPHQGSRIRGSSWTQQPAWSGKASLLTCPVSRRLGSSSRCWPPPPCPPPPPSPPPQHLPLFNSTHLPSLSQSRTVTAA